MSGRCFQVGNPGISPREFTAHARMGQRDVWYGGRAQIRIGLPSSLLVQSYRPWSLTFERQFELEIFDVAFA